MPRIRFTRHADEKFEVVRSYGFAITRSQVEKAITAPDHEMPRGPQFHYVYGTGLHAKFPPKRHPGELAIVAIDLAEPQERAQRDLVAMLDAVRRLLEADLGRA